LFCGTNDVVTPPCHTFVACTPSSLSLDSGAARGAASGGAEIGGAEPGGAEPAGVESRGAEPEGVELGDAESEGAESGGAEPRAVRARDSAAGDTKAGVAGVTARAGGTGGAAGAGPRGARTTGTGASGTNSVGGAGGGGAGAGYPAGAGGTRAGGTGAGSAGAGGVGAGDTGAGGVGVIGLVGAGVTVGASGTGGATAAGPGGALTRGTGAARTGGIVDTGAGDPMEPRASGARGLGAGGTGAGDAGTGGARAVGVGAGGTGTGGAGAGGAVSGGTGAGGTVRPRPYFVPLLQQVLGVLTSTGLSPPLLCPPLDQSHLPLEPASPLPSPSPYTEKTGGLTERREPASRLASHVRTGCRVPRPRPPPVPGTYAMALRPSSIPLHVPLPPPPESSLPVVPNHESDHARAASPTVSRLLATVLTDPSFESIAASALVAELVDFATASRLDNAIALVAESESSSPPSVEGECALGTDVLEDRQEDFECLVAAAPRFASMLLVPEGDLDAPDIPTPCSYAKVITGPYSSQWLAAMDVEMAFWKVKRPPGSPPAFKGHYVARGFSQRQGVDYFQTFSLTPKMTTLWVLLYVTAQRDYELHSLDFCTAFLQGSLHKEIGLRRPPRFIGSFSASTQWSLRWPVYGLRQAPCKWHDTLRTTLAVVGLNPSTADPSLFLHTNTSLPPFYVLVYINNLVFANADTEALTLVKLEL
ncbi:unnamed protein product, partial [Closterium sp. NIES-53]